MPERIVSLAPSGTATLTALGAADRVVGVTHHCELDREPIGGWLNPDLERVEELEPDLAVTSDELQSDITRQLRDRDIDTFHHEPEGLEAVVDGFALLGDAIGQSKAGISLAATSRNRLHAVSDRVPHRDQPVVYCEEWSDPPMVAGNWVPEAVQAAGGQYPFAGPGDRSREIEGSEVVAADPDQVVLHVCGHGDTADAATVRERGWDLDAPVHVLDDSLLNQPSPRLIDGIERLAEVIHTD